MLLGTQHENQKHIDIQLTDVALNPMLSGSGSNLKLAEYFAKSRPTVTTPFGARGYDLRNGTDAIVCGLDRLPQEIRALLSDPEKRAEMGASASGHAHEKLD